MSKGKNGNSEKGKQSFRNIVKSPTKKNSGMIGAGKKTPITIKEDGNKDWAKFAKDVKKAPPAKPTKPESKKATPSPTKAAPSKGISRLKPIASKTAAPKTAPSKSVATPKKATPASGVSKLKVTASKNATAKTVAAPNKTTPSSKGVSKFKAATPKTKQAKAPVKKAPTKGR